MDEAFLARFRERSAYEAGRDGPPDGFPKLPDFPLGRYTDPAFQALEDEFLFARTWLYAAHDSQLPRRAATGCATSAAPRSCWCAATTARCGRSATPAATGRAGGAWRVRHGAPARVPVPLVELRPGRVAGARPGRARLRRAATDERGLPPVRCERWGGWYFVNFDDDADAARRTGSTRSRGCFPRWPPPRCG